MQSDDEVVAKITLAYLLKGVLLNLVLGLAVLSSVLFIFCCL